MKKLLHLTAPVGANKAILTTVNVLVLTTILATAFWFSTTSLVAQGLCTVCHKRTTTLTLNCDSLDYRRHIDHGDPMTACTTPVQNP